MVTEAAAVRPTTGRGTSPCNPSPSNSKNLAVALAGFTAVLIVRAEAWARLASFNRRVCSLVSLFAPVSLPSTGGRRGKALPKISAASPFPACRPQPCHVELAHPEFRRHHAVEPPRVDASEFRQGWRVKTGLDGLLAAGAITPREWCAALAFRGMRERRCGARCGLQMGRRLYRSALPAAAPRADRGRARRRQTGSHGQGGPRRRVVPVARMVCHRRSAVGRDRSTAWRHRLSHCPKMGCGLDCGTSGIVAARLVTIIAEKVWIAVSLATDHTIENSRSRANGLGGFEARPGCGTAEFSTACRPRPADRHPAVIMGCYAALTEAPGRARNTRCRKLGFRVIRQSRLLSFTVQSPYGAQCRLKKPFLPGTNLEHAPAVHQSLTCSASSASLYLSGECGQNGR